MDFDSQLLIFLLSGGAQDTVEESEEQYGNQTEISAVVVCGIGKEDGATVGKVFDQYLYAILGQEQQSVYLAGIFLGFVGTGFVGITADGVAEKGEKSVGRGFCLIGIGTADT